MLASNPQSDTIALMYHGLGFPPGVAVDAHYSVNLDSFSQQLAICRRHGGALVSARDWLAGRPGVILTFDDGDESNYRLAFPTLAEAGAGADFFVNPAQVGQPGYATWSCLREMAAGGMSIQSHGLDHRYFLTQLSEQRLREDLRRARQEIEDHVGQPVALLAPPGGRMPTGLRRISEECGYSHVLHSKPGRVRQSDSGLLCRLAVTAKLRPETLESWLQGGVALLQSRLRYSALGLARRILGDDGYQAVRARLLGTGDH